ncbi:Cucumisin like [Actinidia chinensis var. chinensis]|uniref:Cucumisin like n=1 Tax=Actinidia chinensis var. chinensis TaxID=1590841 RepID=A0A2R6PLL8_ACTCC|nr:Cucumisin like [Actinidia chinensis var. chinensis]
MASKIPIVLWLLLLGFSCIILTGNIEASDAAAQEANMMLLLKRQIFLSALILNAPESLLYSYKKSFNGFVTMLTEEEKLLEWMGWFLCSLMKGNSSTQEVHGTTWVSPNKLKEQLLKETSSLACLTPEFCPTRFYRSNGLFGEGLRSPRDTDGHGTRCASTAAGGLVAMAVYKICWSDGCCDADILEACDDAIADGGWDTDICVNDVPYSASISNVAPWFLLSAASTIDRKFVTKNMNLVRGKIVLCDSWTNGRLPLVAGAAGVVMQDTSFQDYAYSFPLPATHVDVKDYVNWTSNPTATIFKSYEVNETLAPFVASFSSRGPNRITKDVLTPDLTTPGVDILAAWSLVSPVTSEKEDRRRVPYNLNFWDINVLPACFFRDCLHQIVSPLMVSLFI